MQEGKGSLVSQVLGTRAQMPQHPTRALTVVEQKKEEVKHGSPALLQLKKWLEEHSEEAEDPLAACFKQAENGSVENGSAACWKEAVADLGQRAPQSATLLPQAIYC